MSRFDEIIGTRPSHSTGTKEPTTSQREEVGALCNAAKFVAAEAAFEACERAGVLSLTSIWNMLDVYSNLAISVMVHGGMGYAIDFHVERWVPFFLRRAAYKNVLAKSDTCVNPSFQGWLQYLERWSSILLDRRFWDVSLELLPDMYYIWWEYYSTQELLILFL